MAKIGDSIKKEAYAKIEAGIIALLEYADETETDVRRFVESVLNEARRG